MSWCCPVFVCVFVFGVIQAGSKRVRDEEEEESRPESSHTPPTTKKLRLKPTIALQVNTNTHKQEIEPLSLSVAV